GFKADAKQNFLEYADRMQKAGNMDEAIRALKEFCELCPDQDDIRLMLADQLKKLKRDKEALEQLQMLYDRYHSEDRDAEAAATPGHRGDARGRGAADHRGVVGFDAWPRGHESRRAGRARGQRWRHAGSRDDVARRRGAARRRASSGWGSRVHHAGAGAVEAG